MLYLRGCVHVVLNSSSLFTVCSGSRYVAMFPYTPRKEDELELRKGEMFLVLERCQDGWFKGTSMHTGKIGVFPGNYMSPVSRSVIYFCQHAVLSVTHTHAQFHYHLSMMHSIGCQPLEFLCHSFGRGAQKQLELQTIASYFLHYDLIHFMRYKSILFA